MSVHQFDQNQLADSEFTPGSYDFLKVGNQGRLTDRGYRGDLKKGFVNYINRN